MTKAREIPANLLAILQGIYTSYLKAVLPHGTATQKEIDANFETLTQLIAEQIRTPYHFQPFHKAIRTPFDYYKFGLDFVRPVIDIQKSSLQGEVHVQQIVDELQKGDNVILFSNHQSEIDPQAISILLEKKYPSLAEEMIFIAGHRVTTDPMAVPMSLGRNLLCIYSKKYIDQPPELKAEKLAHNQNTLKVMVELLQEGGKCIYVAPSGGRDRRDSTGTIQMAPFDPDSIEMLYLMSQKAGRPTHFYTLSLATYDLLPPPPDIHVEIGEERVWNFVPAHLAFGPEIAMNNFKTKDKIERRRIRAEAIWQQANTAYQKLNIYK